MCEVARGRPSPGPSTRFARSGPPSPRKRGEGQHRRALRVVALLPACGEKVREARMRGAKTYRLNFDGPLARLILFDRNVPIRRGQIELAAAAGDRADDALAAGVHRRDREVA